LGWINRGGKGKKHTKNKSRADDVHVAVDGMIRYLSSYVALELPASAHGMAAMLKL
jgi:hypothetical protein